MAILSAYGYDLRQPWACTRIKSPWIAGSTLLRFQKVTAQTDDHTAFSVLKVSGMEHVWVIPTGTGMLEVPHMENDPHNIAAFNALLSSLRNPPSSASDWEGVGRLYMMMLGHTEVVETAPKSGICDRGNCTVAFSDRAIHPGESFNKWTLTFSAADNDHPTTLEEIKRKTVRERR